MQIIVEDTSWQVFFDTQNQIMEINWLSEANITNQEFMNYLQKWTELIEQYKPKSFLVDSSKYHVVMTIDMQTWHDKTIAPKYLKAEIKKIAFVLPKEIFASTSITQTFEEENAQKIEINYFNDIKLAREWLYETVS